MVIVVVPAAVAVDVKLQLNNVALILFCASHPAKEVAVGEVVTEVTPVPPWAVETKAGAVICDSQPHAHEVAEVPEVDTTVKTIICVRWENPSRVPEQIVFAPLDCATMEPPLVVLVQIIKNCCPRVSVDTTGILTVCPLLPVTIWVCALATVSVVVPFVAAIVPVVGMKWSARVLLFASQPCQLEAVGAVVTEVFEVPPFATAIVVPVQVPLVIVPTVARFARLVSVVFVVAASVAT